MTRRNKKSLVRPGFQRSVAYVYKDVWDQELSPSCVAFASSHLMTILMRQVHNDRKIEISPQQLVNAGRLNLDAKETEIQEAIQEQITRVLLDRLIDIQVYWRVGFIPMPQPSTKEMSYEECLEQEKHMKRSRLFQQWITELSHDEYALQNGRVEEENTRVGQQPFATTVCEQDNIFQGFLS
ncbi:hypothetical protein QVD17_21523 [Tagetes erecta]|uniref:Uncharacterized protein n=1 Tax=Tagetes erecta TaxID=13708 RepID=A0AAD8KCF9_TARER|nr:hypothetical protein QVD17_21523 [Tagetes erecta]